MESIPGKKVGSTIYLHNDFTYSIDSRNPSIYRCSCRRTSNCRGAVSINIDSSITVLKNHNHPKRYLTMTSNHIKNEMLTLCRETSLPPKEIFNEICRRYPDAAVKISYVSMKSVLFRERAKHRLPLPECLLTLSNNLLTYMPTSSCYKGCVTSTDGKLALIFSSDCLLKALGSSNEMYVDGTFSIIPRKPSIMQMYSIHIRYMDTGIGTVFVLCEARTTSLYQAIWKKIVEFIPILQDNITFAMSDYETAAVNAMSDQFPRAELHGCWFHFNQALLRKWNHLGLKDAPNDVLSMSMTMALAPSMYFKQALVLIEEQANAISSEYAAILQFITYLQTTWLPIATRVSVYECPVRTNNIAESFHNVAMQKFRASHTNIWQFLGNLQNLIRDEDIKLSQLINGQMVRRVSNSKNRIRDAKIVEAQRNLTSGRLPLGQFLRVFQKSNEKVILKANADLEDMQPVELSSSVDTKKCLSTSTSQTHLQGPQLNLQGNARQSIVEKENMQDGIARLRPRRKKTSTLGLHEKQINCTKSKENPIEVQVLLHRIDDNMQHK